MVMPFPQLSFHNLPELLQPEGQLSPGHIPDLHCTWGYRLSEVEVLLVTHSGCP